MQVKYLLSQKGQKKAIFIPALPFSAIKEVLVSVEGMNGDRTGWWSMFYWIVSSGQTGQTNIQQLGWELTDI